MHQNLNARAKMPAEISRVLFSSESRIFNCFPGGNDTYIVVNPDIPRQAYGECDALIKERAPHFEQGAFLEPVRGGSVVARMQMAGGEFCGNATRAVCATLAEDFLGARSLGHIASYQFVQQDQDALVFPVEVSGAEGAVSSRVRRCADGWDVTIKMPSTDESIYPQSTSMEIEARKVPCSVVQLPGITHVLVSPNDLPFRTEPKYLRDCLTALRSQLNLSEMPAVGLIWYGGEGDATRIDPVVYVKEIDSCIYESACGSGTVALAHYLLGNKLGSIQVLQPSGAHLTVSMEAPSHKERSNRSGGSYETYLSGPVTIRGQLT